MAKNEYECSSTNNDVNLHTNISDGSRVRPLKDRSSARKFSAARSGDLMMTFFGLLSSGDDFLPDTNLDCIEDTDLVDLADCIDFFPWLTALPVTDFLPDFLFSI